MTGDEKSKSLAKGLGRNLKFLREHKGMTQDQLATEFEVSQSTIAAWERGAREPGLYHLVHMKQFFDVDLYELIYGSYVPPLAIRNLVFLQDKYEVSNQEIAMIMGLNGIELKHFSKYGFTNFEYSRENLHSAAEYFGFYLWELVIKDLSQEVSECQH